MRPGGHAFVLASLVATAFLGCATPAPTVRLQPTSLNVIWVAGRAVVAREEAGVRAAVAFEHQDGHLLALRLEVENRTDEPLVVDPGDITFSACLAATVTSCTQAQRVVNPERVLASLERTRSRATAAAADEQAFLGTLVFLNAVADVASVASGTADGTTGLGTLAMANYQSNAATRHDSAQASLSAQRRMWSDVAFRRNTLPPGRGASGQVFVPIHPDAHYLWVQLRAGERAFPFRFQQTVTPVRRW